MNPNLNTTEQGSLNSSLSSLAMLSLRLQGGKDYLDYLHGFVIEALRRIEAQAIDAVSVQQMVESEFGLKIPAATFAIYLKRLVKDGTISATGTGVQFCVTKLPNTTVSADREAARAKIADVTDQLAGFAYNRYSLKWDERISSGAIADFLRRYSIDFLRFAESKSPLPESAADKENTAYVVAAFVNNSAKEHPGLFESIKVLVQSHILANALMCPDLEKTTRGFKGVHFLADTRFLIKALDLESQYDTDNARALLAAIRTLKGMVCIFPETKDELRSVLKAISRGMQQGAGRGPVYRELLKRRRGVADVILAESNLDATLASLSISVLQSPNYGEDTYQFQIDESELRDEIENEVDYITDHAANHDIRVVRHIFALRKGRHASTIEDAGYVFLTTNSALSRAAFYYERKNSTGWIFSAVVTDYHLSHLAWLKSPMETQDLPRAEILANCYATMRPHEAMWNRYLEEVARLKAENKVSTKDHEVLRFSLNAPDELMNVTRGDVEGITVANLNKILEKLEKTYAADKEQQLEQVRQEHEATKKALAELELVAQQSDKEKSAAVERQAALEQVKAAHEAELQQLKGSEAEAKARDERRVARIDRIAERVAKGSFVVSGLAFAAIGVLALLSYLSAWYGVPAAVVGFFNLWSGFSGNTVERVVKRWIAARLAQFMN